MRAMKSKIAIVVLAVAAAALIVALIYVNQQATAEKTKDTQTITTLSNQLAQVTDTLAKHDLVITNLESDLNARAADILSLSNTLSTTTATLSDTRLALTNAQQEIARRDEIIAKRDEAIAKLEAHNQSLELQATELDTLITNLNLRIGDISQKLTAAEGDKAALSKELKRLTAEKAELERKFNDITALREQVRKIRAGLAIARRDDRAQEGLPASYEPKGAQQQLRNLVPKPHPKHYDLNVEVNTDGSVKIIPPLTTTNSAAH
jgi:chromosome segregation ATPase